MSEVQIKQTIGQLEASIEKAEKFLTDEEFKDYCDSAYMCISHWRIILRKVKQKEDGTQS